MIKKEMNKHRTSNEICGYIMLVCCLLFWKHLFFSTGYELYLMLILTFLLGRSAVYDSIISKRSNVPSETIIRKEFYELHLNSKITNSVELVCWMLETIEFIINHDKDKYIIMEVSPKIIKEDRIRRIFGDDNFEVSDVNFITKIGNYSYRVWEFLLVLISFFCKKKIKLRKLSNMKKYEIDGSKIDYDELYEEIKKMKLMLTRRYK